MLFAAVLFFTSVANRARKSAVRGAFLVMAILLFVVATRLPGVVPEARLTAQAALAAAEAAAAGEEPPEAEASEEPGKAPSNPPATVARVQQAEADSAPRRIQWSPRT